MTEEQGFQISTIWPDVGSLPTFRVNQALSQLGQDGGLPDECVLTLGYLAPPVLLGTPEEQLASLAALGAVPIKGVIRVSINRAMIDQLIAVLKTAADTWDGAIGGGEK